MKINQATRRSGAGEGFSLIEVVVALAVVSVGLLGFSKAILDAMVLNQTNRESGLARRSAQAILADIEATAFDEVFARYNATVADDLGAGDHLLGVFPVVGLRLRDDEADGFAGDITFPASFTFGGQLQLREDFNDSSFGMPRDLNLDGVVDGADHSADYKLLPVLVRVAWQGRAGQAKVEFRTVLIEQ
ncbi:MAG: prepilin-type N-terminal cleavage/methylation domain-containing protein [Planctomycetota bacterium]|nr:prepilin-type N-terminal cleavage/methylation domain-containing protein [Planctomycetota bacterium]